MKHWQAPLNKAPSKGGARWGRGQGRTKKEEKPCMKFLKKNKNQGLEPIHQKYNANESTSRHNPKKKQKKTINKNKVNTLCKYDSWS
jgi:hypothetical protein